MTKNSVKKKKSSKLNKREILFKLIHRPPKPTREFMTKEFTLLKKIFEKFPDEQFWLKCSFNPVNSLAIHIAMDMKEIEKKYKDFYYEPEFKNVEINIGEKTGEDYNITVKPRTIKDFLK